MARRKYSRKEISTLHELFAKRLTVAECARQLAMPESTVRDHFVRWQKRPEVATLSYTEDLDVLACMRRVRSIGWYHLMRRVQQGEVTTKELIQILFMIERELRLNETFGFGQWLSEEMPVEVLSNEHLKRAAAGEPYHMVLLSMIRDTAKGLVEKRKRDDEAARFRQLS